MSVVASNKTDQLLETIADYVIDYQVTSEQALDTAHSCIVDTISCAILALGYPECTKHLGPVVEGTVVPDGTPVFGTPYRLDPVKAAYDLTCLIRWLDFNDTWLAKEWGHPSDNLGAILAAADYANRHLQANYTFHDVMVALTKAYEIQGQLAIDNCFNALGIDHVVLVKLASCALATQLLGGDRETIIRAISQVMVDGQSLRAYRHAPNAGSRKSWAAGDACARAMQFALISLKGEMGYPSAITAPKWGMNDTLMRGNALQLERPLTSYVMENILFKIAYPAEFHAQTAVECALKLHPQVKGRIDDITHIELTTQEPAVRIIAKDGPLGNPADRDHCLQYMVAVALLCGELTADHYSDAFAADHETALGKLRNLMQVTENPEFTKNYYDLDRRGIGNSLQVFFNDGSKTELLSIEYPVGHRQRRDEGAPLLLAKYHNNLQKCYSSAQKSIIDDMLLERDKLADLRVDIVMDALAS